MAKFAVETIGLRIKIDHIFAYLGEVLVYSSICSTNWVA